MIQPVRRVANKSKPKKARLTLPPTAVQAFGLPKQIYNCSNQELLSLADKIQTSPDDFELLNAFFQGYLDFIRDCTHPLEHLNQEYFTRYQLAQRAQASLEEGDEKVRTNKPQEAIPHYQKSLLIYPYNNFVRVNVALLHLDTSQVQLAKQHCLEGLSRAPKFALLWRILGKSYIFSGELKLAQEALFRALQLYGGYEEITAEALAEIGAVIPIFNDQSSDRPTYVPRGLYRKLLVTGIQSAQKSEDALHYFEEAIRRKFRNLFLLLWPPTKERLFADHALWDEKTYLLEGLYYHSIKQNDLAAVAWTEGLKKYPKAAQLYSNLAQIQKDQEARESLEKAFQYGDRKIKNIALYFSILEKQLSFDEAKQLMYQLATLYNDASFIQIVSDSQKTNRSRRQDVRFSDAFI